MLVPSAYSWGPLHLKSSAFVAVYRDQVWSWSYHLPYIKQVPVLHASSCLGRALKTGWKSLLCLFCFFLFPGCVCEYWWIQEQVPCPISQVWESRPASQTCFQPWLTVTVEYFSLSIAVTSSECRAIARLKPHWTMLQSLYMEPHWTTLCIWKQSVRGRVWEPN